MEKHVFKVCQNRGNARIWIEGDRLSSIHICAGDRFELIKYKDTLILDFDSLAPTNKVSGKPGRPVIDLTGKWVTAFFGDATHYVAFFRDAFHGNGRPTISIMPTEVK